MNIRIIDSIKDPLVILARELVTSSGRNVHKKCMLFGEEQIRWAIEANIIIEAMFCKKCPDFLQETIIPVFETSEGILKKISDTNYVIPLLAIAHYPINNNKRKQDFVVVLDNVVDFGNIGTIVRTAQSFFINTFVFSVDGDPFQRKVIDSSRGLVFQSNFEFYNNPHTTIVMLKKQNYQLVVTSPHAPTLQSHIAFNKDRPIALVIGNETKGVDPEFEKEADFVIQIPMASHVESLNVGVFTGISLYELKFKQVLSMLKEKILMQFGREINVAGKLVQMAFDKKISRVTDLKGQHVILLMIMQCDEHMTLNQIAQDVSLYGDYLKKFLAPLIAKKFIEQNSNDNFVITDKGKQFLAEIWSIVEQMDQLIFHHFTPQEKEQFLDFLHRIQDSCSAIIAE